MDRSTIEMMLKARAQSEYLPEATVQGISMNPFLYEGDVVLIKKQDEYKVGDVLVFIYKDEGLLIHRLLRISDGRYYCKGDNAFRMEDIQQEQIIGRGISVRGSGRISPDGWKLWLLCRMSLKVNRLFIKAGRQIEPVKKTWLCKFYRLIFFKTSGA